MNDAERVSDVQRAFPDFVVESWRPLGEGWMSRALLLNDAWVARFAKSADASSDLAKEAAVLPIVARGVSLPVPRFERVGEQRDGLSFVMYRLLPGEPMAETLGEATPPRVAAQLATFLDELQALSVSELEAAGLPSTNLRANIAERLESWRGIRADLPPDLFAYVAQRFERYLANSTFHTDERRFVHGDLSPDHFLFDASRGELSGIIDFGDCGLGDPDYDFVYLLEDAGEAFTRRVLERRGEPNVEAKLRKLRYLVTFAHAQGVLAAARYGKPEHRAECLEALRAECSARVR